MTGNDEVMMVSNTKLTTIWKIYLTNWLNSNRPLCCTLDFSATHPPWPAGWRPGPCPPPPCCRPRPGPGRGWRGSSSAAAARLPPCDPGAAALAAPPTDGCQTDQWRTDFPSRIACPLKYKRCKLLCIQNWYLFFVCFLFLPLKPYKYLLRYLRCNISTFINFLIPISGLKQRDFPTFHFYFHSAILTRLWS